MGRGKRRFNKDSERSRQEKKHIVKLNHLVDVIPLWFSG